MKETWITFVFLGDPDGLEPVLLALDLVTAGDLSGVTPLMLAYPLVGSNRAGEASTALNDLARAGLFW